MGQGEAVSVPYTVLEIVLIVIVGWISHGSRFLERDGFGTRLTRVFLRLMCMCTLPSFVESSSRDTFVY